MLDELGRLKGAVCRDTLLGLLQVLVKFIMLLCYLRIMIVIFSFNLIDQARAFSAPLQRYPGDKELTVVPLPSFYSESVKTSKKEKGKNSAAAYFRSSLGKWTENLGRPTVGKKYLYSMFFCSAKRSLYFASPQIPYASTNLMQDYSSTCAFTWTLHRTQF